MLQNQDFTGKYVLVHILAKVCILGVLMVRHRASNGKMNKIDKNSKNIGVYIGGLKYDRILGFH